MLRGLARSPSMVKTAVLNKPALGCLSQRRYLATQKEPVRVAITGPAGAIGYAALFRIASGEMLGKDQPVIIQCLELPQSLGLLNAIKMELDDCAFPLLRGVVQTDDPRVAFEGADYALLIGAKPRTKGMERADLLKGNAAIFQAQGKALNDVANRDTLKVVVVGNPANTNALIASANAPDIDPNRFTALTTLDHFRGLSMLAEKTGTTVNDIEKFAIWGNHSPSMYANISQATINGKPAKEVVDMAWYKDEFLDAVGKRGAAVIAARGGTSSAASAANAALMHMQQWALGTNGQWTSMGIWSPPGFEGVYYSVPVVCENGEYKRVEGITHDDFDKERLQLTYDELLKEKEQTNEFRP